MAQTDRQTDRHTDGHADSMTDPAQRAESVKIIGPEKFLEIQQHYQIRMIFKHELISCLKSD